MRVTVIGEGERAEAHRAWYRQAGVDLVAAGGDHGQELPEAALYDVCGEPEERQQALGLLVRRRHAAILLVGRLAPSAEAAARLVGVARRGRCDLAVTGGTRFVPAFARLRELVCGGILGTVREVRVQVTTAPAWAAEVQLAGMDLGLWLAGDDAPPVAGCTTPGGTDFRAGATQVAVVVTVDAAQAGTAWQVASAADLGQAVAQAVFHPGLPGACCRGQALAVTLAGRQRLIGVAAADPAGNELGAVLARQAAGLPWLGLCPAERAARLLAVLEDGTGKVSGARLASS